ncbi:MAG: hypothetical protein IT427_00305 [Pirellulales bacterium]|nr:hypothetical protein [Pirellulales bacterium]
MDKPEIWTPENARQFFQATNIEAESEFGIENQLIIRELSPDCGTQDFRVTIDGGKLIKHCSNKNCFGERLKLRWNVPTLRASLI